MNKTLKEWEVVTDKMKYKEGRKDFNYSYDFYGALELAMDILNDWKEQNNKLADEGVDVFWYI